MESGISGIGDLTTNPNMGKAPGRSIMTESLFKFVAPQSSLSVTALGMIHTMLIMGKEDDHAYSLTEIVVTPEDGPPLHRGGYANYLDPIFPVTRT
jgi:hypothetical protein